MSKVAYRARSSPYPIITVDKAIDFVMEEANTLSTEMVNFRGQYTFKRYYIPILSNYQNIADGWYIIKGMG